MAVVTYFFLYLDKKKISSAALTALLRRALYRERLTTDRAHTQDFLLSVSRTTRLLFPARQMKRPQLLILFTEITFKPKLSGSAAFLYAVTTLNCLFLMNSSES